MLLYTIFTYVGFFLIMLICMIVAIITAKNKISWYIYVLGALIQLLSLYGNQKANAYSYLKTDLSSYWIIYALILTLTAAIIFARKRKFKESKGNKINNSDGEDDEI